ncbi:uncharacterized protein TrAtP1_006312 [Trichoderma atroviride]|uniref:uncharacterized protein n=1 Tax=Hypocrea atroviridis TaxID=63577 RepID=UPI00331B8B68|nr:hypothetical protein TrAtP1_006312 [Trichoderma atroviride]
MNKYSHPGDRSFNDVSKEIIRIHCDWKSMQKMQDQVGTENTHFVVPFGQNESFVGRQGIVEKLRQRLPARAYENTCQRTAIMGPSGLGKTQIAIEAVYRIHRDHPHCSIFWVPAMNIATFENAYREIGQALNVAGIADVKANIKTIVKTALSHKSAGEWLLVLDSMNDMEVAKEIYDYLPFSLKGSILFTTQSKSIVAGMDLPKDGIHAISSMERSESIQLLKCRLDNKQVTDSKSLNMLADFLGDIPLAIRQAASYIFETQITTAKYLERCKSDSNGMTEFVTKGFEDEVQNGILRCPTATTCRLSVDRLAISQFMRKLMQVENTWTEENASVIKKLADFAPEPTEDNRDLWMEYLPHFLGALEPRHGALDEQDIVLRHKIRNSYIVTGKDKEAKEIFQDVVRAAGEGLFNTTSADKRLETVINDVLGILHKQGRHEEAGSVSREIMRFQRRVANVRHLDTALAIFSQVMKERRS